MKANVSLIKLENLKEVKVNFISCVSLNDLITLAEVIRIEKNKKDIKYILKDIFTGKELTGDSESVEMCVKLICETENMTFPVVYRLTKQIVSAKFNELKEGYNGDLDILADGFIKQLLSGDIKISVIGTINHVHTKPVENDSVEIISLHIIDKENIYNRADRIYKIKSIVDFGKFTERFNLINDKGNVIVCKRKDFKLLGKTDYKKVFTV